MFGNNHSDNDQSADSVPAITPVGPASQDSNSQDWQHPGTPIDDGQPAATAPVPAAEPADAATTALPTEEPAAAAPADTPDTNELIDIKQDALNQLSPLVGHLDQTPEEKFRTTMMMIQASDDQSLVKTAYEAAKQITDEKIRAQALLDIVNEINYFTQHQQQS